MDDDFTYKHILLAIDFSDCTSLIAHRAKKIADLTNAKLSIVHVMSHLPIAYSGEFSIPIDVELENSLVKQTCEKMKKLGRQLNVPENDQHIKEGSVKTTVTALAEEIKADLIVVGSHGHQGLALLLGSQANAILHAAQCDVWTIHIPEEN